MSAEGSGVSTEPWWIKGDRERLEQMRNAIKGKPDTAMVRYCGDMSPMLRSDVYAKMLALQARIAADIAAHQAEVGSASSSVTPVYAEKDRLSTSAWFVWSVGLARPLIEDITEAQAKSIANALNSAPALAMDLATLSAERDRLAGRVDIVTADLLASNAKRDEAIEALQDTSDALAMRESRLNALSARVAQLTEKLAVSEQRYERLALAVRQAGHEWLLSEDDDAALRGEVKP